MGNKAVGMALHMGDVLESGIARIGIQFRSHLVRGKFELLDWGRKSDYRNLQLQGFEEP